VGRKRARKAGWSPSHAPATRNNPKPGGGQQTSVSSFEPSPKIMIFGRFQIGPAADFDVTVRSDPEVGAMNVGMGSVNVDRVTAVKTRWNFGAVLIKSIDRNDAGYGLDSGCREVDLIAQPGGWNDTIGVSIGEP
jgi:hypothetical protein